MGIAIHEYLWIGLADSLGKGIWYIYIILEWRNCLISRGVICNESGEWQNSKATLIDYRMNGEGTVGPKMAVKINGIGERLWGLEVDEIWVKLLYYATIIASATPYIFQEVMKKL